MIAFKAVLCAEIYVNVNVCAATKKEQLLNFYSEKCCEIVLPPRLCSIQIHESNGTFEVMVR